MKILLFSDSHGHTDNMVKVIKKSKQVDMIIHLGDVLRDACFIRDTFTNTPVEFVTGNNDWAREVPSEKLLEIEGKKIFITHGHHYNVKNDYGRIILRGKSVKADAVFFGHTHEVEEMFSDGMMVLNPGSISLPVKSSNPTCAVIEICDGKLSSRFIGLG